LKNLQEDDRATPDSPKWAEDRFATGGGVPPEEADGTVISKEEGDPLSGSTKLPIALLGRMTEFLPYRLNLWFPFPV
jgi:hypothetical protein